MTRQGSACRRGSARVARFRLELILAEDRYRALMHGERRSLRLFPARWLS